MISNTKDKSERGALLGNELGLSEGTLFEVLVSQYEAAKYEVETGSCKGFTEKDPGYRYIECKNSEERMKKVGDRGACFITYFNYEGTKITEIKVLIEKVKEVIIEKKGEYVL